MKLKKQSCLILLLFGWFLFANVATLCAQATTTEAKPNILWITSEDNGPHLGCYGDEFATTPKLDELAERGSLYRHVWSNAPVCAPARTTLITGRYPQSLGAEHMRSSIRLPENLKLFPQILREHGYYCSNNRKEDYNFEKPRGLWDQSNRQAHWRNRAADQPFFSVFNYTVSHESQIRKRPHTLQHDPAGVRVPAYHPDHETVRQDWAQYYDKVSEMDARAGETLAQLAADQLEDNTIIFYFADHGSGMPRHKRFPGNSGLSVPLIVYIPDKFKKLRSDDYQTGGESSRLVSFVDFAPTVLSLAGIKPPDTMQGNAFLGEFEAQPNEFLHGFRGRMDERYDLVRSARDERFVYIRNFYPQLPHGQFLHYQFQTPTTELWYKQFIDGNLNAIQRAFWSPRPVEEFYDLQADPDETINLAQSNKPDIADQLTRMRKACRDHCHRIRDLGFIPEPDIHKMVGEKPPADYFAEKSQPVKTAIDTAFNMTKQSAEVTSVLPPEKSAAEIFWGLQAIEIQGKPSFDRHQSAIEKLLGHASTSVQVKANSLMVRYSSEAEQVSSSAARLMKLGNVEHSDDYTVFMALNAIDYLDEKFLPHRSELQSLPRNAEPPANSRVKNYPSRLIDKILDDLD